MHPDTSLKASTKGSSAHSSCLLVVSVLMDRRWQVQHPDLLSFLHTSHCSSGDPSEAPEVYRPTRLDCHWSDLGPDQSTSDRRWSSWSTWS